MRILYHTPLSPFCRKVRVLLAEKGLDFELKEVDFWEEGQEFFALNPAGEVPVMREEDGSLYTESYAICEYIEEIYTDKPMLGINPAERAEIRRLVGWFDNKFNFEVSQNILFEKIFKRVLHLGCPDSEAIREGKVNILHHLDYIGYLLEKRRWLAGEMFTLADITAAAHLSALDYLGDVPWEHNRAAKEWYALAKSRPSFRSILFERITGFKPPAHYEDPDF